MRATNHHGRGTARHNRHKDFASPHIDKKRTKYNILWALGEKPQRGNSLDIEAAERRYYEQTFTESLEAQNARHIKSRHKERVRTMDDIYRKIKPPEESLLYIGNKKYRGDVDIDTLWECVVEYIEWEMDYSKQHGNFYQVLSLALHANEKGQIHVHERGVYQYQSADGWKLEQVTALKKAGFPLPEPEALRDNENNRKAVWDAGRREKWIDIIESHGYQIEREPEEDRPHMGLEAWQALQDAKRDLQEAQEAILKQRVKDLDNQMAIKARNVLQDATAEADKIRQQADRMQQELAKREAIIAQKEAILTDIDKANYKKKLQEQKQTERRAQEAELQLGDAAVAAAPPRHGKRIGKIPRKEEKGMDF